MSRLRDGLGFSALVVVSDVKVSKICGLDSFARVSIVSILLPHNITIQEKMLDKLKKC